MERLKQSEIVMALLEVLEPFSIFAAQLLWVAQPSLSILIDRERISGWAELLEDPQRIAQLREQWLADKTHE